VTQNDRNLIIEIRNLAKAERALTSQLLEKIALVHERRLYADLGYPSLLAWMMGDLHYSKSAAFRRISAARLIQDIPQAKVMVEDGQLNVTTMTQLKSAIQQTEKETKTKISLSRKEELISKIKNKSSDETDRVIAIEFPDLRPRPPETIRAVGLEESELTIVLNKEQMAILNRVKEVTSHSHFNASMAELIEVMGRFFLRHNDPLMAKLRESTTLALNKSMSTGAAAEPNSGLDQTILSVRESTVHESNVCSPSHQFRHGEQSVDLGENLIFGEDGQKDQIDQNSNLIKLDLQSLRSTPTMAASQPRRMAHHRNEKISSSKRKPLPATIRNLVFQRDGTSCTFVSPETGHACNSRVLIEVGHINAKASGGNDHPENLRPLCRAHNRLAWKTQHQRRWLSSPQVKPAARIFNSSADCTTRLLSLKDQ
jgi:5-methylcytosine-specific restriction endonuclease McrA